MIDRLELFCRLGERLRDFGKTPESERLIAQSVEANGWFTREDIIRAVDAIRREMLSREQLEAWLEHYPTVSGPKRVAVIMAGNIPLVGFFDLLCVLTAGHACHIKPSSKDRVLMDFIAATLREIDPTVPIHDYSPSEVYDMAIATGGDDANRYFREHFSSTRALLRGSRHSIAILDGAETEEELRGLVTDITAYSGLGCRSVAMLFVPRGSELRLPTTEPVNPKLRGGLRSTVALLELQHASYTYHGAFVTLHAEDFPMRIAVVTIREYDTLDEVREWIEANAESLQCIVSHAAIAGAVPFGRAQYPTLWDYADGVDTMRWLGE
jgi:hypothetical protein